MSAKDEELVAKVANMIAKRRLTSPAIMALEVGRPLNFVASQFLAFIAPFATMLLNEQEYRRFTEILEHRESVDVLVRAIVRADESAQQHNERGKNPSEST